MTSSLPIPILSKSRSKNNSSSSNGSKDSPQRMRVCGRGGAGNMHTPSEIKAADEEECRLTAELCNSHPIHSTSEVKSTRRASLFSLSSFSSRSTTSSATSSFLEKFGLSRTKSKSVEEQSIASSKNLSKTPSETPSTASISEE